MAMATDLSYVIVGASIAGLSAAETLRTLTDAPILLVDGDPDAPCDRTALSKDVLIAPEVGDGVFLRTEAQLAEQRIAVRRQYAAGLDASRHELELCDGTVVRYSRLLIAAGASPFVPFAVAPDVELHLVRSLADARGLRSQLVDGTSVAIIGSGLIGCEVASATRSLGLETSIVSIYSGPFAKPLGVEVSDYFRAMQAQAGVRTHYSTGVTRISARAGVVQIELDNGAVIESDVVVAGTGVLPNVEWLAGSGVELDNGIICDDCLTTNLPDVYAAGDIARWPGGPFGELIRLEHWTNAADQGHAVARVMWGDCQSAPDLPVPYFMSSLHGKRVQSAGYPALSDECKVFRLADGAGLVALYRKKDRLVGCLTVDKPRLLVKFNALLSERASWHQALERATELLPAAVT
jgi:NADPH-dependent 2,4-dienoyl-CoA reductase/sulfur reductase-like enzyme